jgi:uncharacterized protein (DUF1800 family)
MLPPPESGLEAYNGPWDAAAAAHLLRRATFGPTKAVINQAVELGLDGTIGKLFDELPLPAPPVYYDYENDPNAGLGETWIDQPVANVQGLNFSRRKSLSAWTMALILEEGISLREKMTLFWHNHFAVSRAGVSDQRFFYRYITTIRSQALGNFRQLVKDITIDPTMLRFLNGNQNTANAPNENYARELLELFTIGKGPLAGPGDYTHYTEEDVVQMARVLTGWRDRGHNSQDPDVPVESFFVTGRHDNGDKQLSHRFDEAVISDLGDQEYAYLVDLIFTRDEVARFISRKLYRWFVYYVIDDSVEQQVIEPMAQLLIDADYDIRPALEALLRSAHFYDALSRGPMIRPPLDFLFTILKTAQTPIPAELTPRYQVLWQFFRRLIDMQQEYFELPDVAGWKAYYQEPLYYRNWISANTLKERSELAVQLANNGYFFNGNRIKLEPLDWITTFDNPMEVNAMITEMVTLLYPQPLADGQLASLKEVLIPGLPDFEWELEYGNYLGNPNDQDLRNAVDSKLRDLLTTILNLAEFHLS